MSTSLKNHKYGCKQCEFCGSENLKREDMSMAKLTEWKCNECESEHYWAWENQETHFQLNTKE